MQKAQETQEVQDIQDVQEKKLHRNFDFLDNIKNFPAIVKDEILRAEKNYYDDDFTGSGRAIRAMAEAMTAVLLEEADVDLKAQIENPKWQEGDDKNNKIWDMKKLHDRICYLHHFEKISDNASRNLHTIRQKGNRAAHANAKPPTQEETAKLLRSSYFLVRELAGKYKTFGGWLHIPKFYLGYEEDMPQQTSANSSKNDDTTIKQLEQDKQDAEEAVKKAQQEAEAAKQEAEKAKQEAQRYAELLQQMKETATQENTQVANQLKQEAEQARKRTESAEAVAQKAIQAAAQLRAKLEQAQQEKEAVEKALAIYHQRIKELERAISQAVSPEELSRLQQEKRDIEIKLQQTEKAYLEASRSAAYAHAELAKSKNTTQPKETINITKQTEQNATQPEVTIRATALNTVSYSSTRYTSKWREWLDDFLIDWELGLGWRVKIINFLLNLLFGIGMFVGIYFYLYDDIHTTKNNILEKTYIPSTNTPIIQDDNFKLAMQYKEQKDWDNALKYFEKAAPNNRFALYEMATINNKEKNKRALALKQYNQFIDPSFPTIADQLATYEAATLYNQNGSGTQTEIDLAIQYYKKLINNKTILPEVYLELSDLVYEKHNEERDNYKHFRIQDKQEQILLKGANLGLLTIQETLAMSYYIKAEHILKTGSHDERENMRKKSFYWKYQIASNLDYNQINHKKYNFDGSFTKADLATFQVMVGENYRDGLGVEKDIEKAKYWLKIAYKNGDTDAKNKLDELNAK